MGKKKKRKEKMKTNLEDIQLHSWIHCACKLIVNMRIKACQQAYGEDVTNSVLKKMRKKNKQMDK